MCSRAGLHMLRLSLMPMLVLLLGGWRHLLIWRLPQLAWYWNIALFSTQTMFLLLPVRSYLSLFYSDRNSPSFIHWMQADLERFHQEKFWSLDGIYKSLQGPGNTPSRKNWPASVIWFSGNTWFANAQSKNWLMQRQERNPAASCVHSRDPKTLYIPWATQVQKNHFWARLSCLLHLPILDADFAVEFPLHFLHNTLEHSKT